MNRKNIIFLLALCMSYASSFALINFRSTTAGFRVAEGAGLVLEKTIPECKGHVTKESGAEISGQKIQFNKGIFEDSGNRMFLVGAYLPGTDNIIHLDGDKRFKGTGKQIAQEINIKNGNNRLEGEILLSNNIIFFDENASLTCAITRSLAKSIELNGGTLYLEENLSFVDGQMLLCHGTVLCNGRKIVLGAKEMTWNGSIYFDNGNDIELKATLNLAQTWTFSGRNSTIIGNGNILNLGNYGNIVVERGATLLLKNIILQDVAGSNLRCLDNAGKIIFQNAALVQSGEYTFGTGAFEVIGTLDLIGSQTFVFQPTATCTVNANSLLHLTNNMTFSVDFTTPKIDNLAFVNDSSSIFMSSGASLHVTSTGMALKNGKLVVQGLANVYVEMLRDPVNYRVIEQGLTFGSDAGEDFSCELLPGGLLSLNSGYLIYKNVAPSSWKMYNSLSTLTVNAASLLKLCQPMYLGLGRLRIEQTATLLQAGPNYLDGSIEIFSAT
jgi:hypothetical protein